MSARVQTLAGLVVGAVIGIGAGWFIWGADKGSVQPPSKVAQPDAATAQNTPASARQSVDESAGEKARVKPPQKRPFPVIETLKSKEAPPVKPKPLPPVIQADFARSSDGFTFVNDPFRGTKSPRYARGKWTAIGGRKGGALKIELGGHDNKGIQGMSGGWRRKFILAEPAKLVLTFHYILTQASDYEDDEISQVIVTVDGKHVRVGDKDHLAQIAGDGNGGDERTTGWQVFTARLGELSAGKHTFLVGGYNSKKTLANESTEVLIDDVKLLHETPDILKHYPEISVSVRGEQKKEEKKEEKKDEGEGIEELIF